MLRILSLFLSTHSYDTIILHLNAFDSKKAPLLYVRALVKSTLFQRNDYACPVEPNISIISLVVLTIAALPGAIILRGS